MCLPGLTRPPPVAMETGTQRLRLWTEAAGAQGQVTAANTRRAISIHKPPALVSINHPRSVVVKRSRGAPEHPAAAAAFSSAPAARFPPEQEGFVASGRLPG